MESLRWDLEQNPGRSKCALVSLKSCAKKPLPAAFLVIYLAWVGSSISTKPYIHDLSLFPIVEGNRKFKLIRASYNHSQYETQPLQEALITAFSEDEYLFGGPRPLDSFGSEVKIAVTTTSAAGTPVILTNYNRSCTEKRKS